MIVHVLTINLRRETTGDGPDNWPLRKHRTAQLIRDYRPDCFGSQEGYRPQIEALAGLLEEYTLVAAHRRWDEERMYPCLFIRTRRFKAIRSGDFWLSKTPFKHASKDWDSAFPRLATWALLEALPEGEPLFCCVTHLDHMSARARSGQAGVLAAQLKQLVPPSDPLILMGDFNDRPGSDPYRLLTTFDPPFRDAWVEAEKTDRNADTWHGFRGNGDRGRLDWILYRGPIRILNIRILHDTYDNRYPSDHFPVYAEMEISRA